MELSRLLAQFLPSLAAIPITSSRHHSSFHSMVKIGIYPEHWAGDVCTDGGDFSERP